MHTNTITIFLVEITTNERFKSYNNPLFYSLKYGTTAKFRNFGSKVYFIAENLHLIETKDCESSVIQTGPEQYSGYALRRPFVTSAHSRAAGISKDRQPGLPGNSGERDGPVYQESVVKRSKGQGIHVPVRISAY
jgi:hypothetical protein